MIHTVRDGDTVITLAARYLGDTARWPEIVRANTLRAPYISTDPADQFGTPFGSLTLTHALQAGQVNVHVVATGAAAAGMRLVMERWNADGSVTTFTSLIQSIAGQTLTLADPAPSLFGTTATATLYPAPLDLRGRVATVGESLIIPVTDLEAELLTNTPNLNIYGSDLACNQDGLLLVSTTGDLEKISGLSNLAQQLKLRVLTEPGSLIQHPTYGCDVHAYIGQTMRDTYRTLVAGAIASAMTADTRVEEVTGSQTDVLDGVVIVRATVRARSQETLLLQLELPS